MGKKLKKNLSVQKRRLNKILKQVSGDFSNFEGDLIEPATIKGSGVVYCYAPSNKEFVKIERGTVVYVVDDNLEDGYSLIYSYEGHLVKIERDELIEMGFE
jgi:hypothetical protein